MKPPESDTSNINMIAVCFLLELPSVRAGLVGALMAAFFVFVILAATGLSLSFPSLLRRNATIVAHRQFAAPTLETRSDGLADPGIAQQQAGLEHFRWIDRAHGVFQIPIERAMRLVAARSAKAYDPVPAATQAATQ